MEELWRGPHDIGLSLRTLACLWNRGEGFWRHPRIEAWVLPCGKLLRCWGCLKNEDAASLRKPATIVIVRETQSLEKAPASFDGNVVEYELESLPSRFDITDEDLRSNLQRLLHLLEGLSCPVLINSGLGCEKFVDFSIIAVLKVLGSPDDVVADAKFLWPNTQEAETEHVLAGFREYGGVESYLSEIVNPAALRNTFVGSSSVIDMRDWRGKESAWLKEDIKLMFKNARHAEENQDESSCVSNVRVKMFWYNQVAIAGEQLADISSASEAAAALFFRGSSLARLAASNSAKATDARYALELGAILASRDTAKKIVQQLDSELASVPRLVDACLVEAKDSVNAVDASQRVFVVDLEGTADEDVGESENVRRFRTWQVLPAPARFSWTIFEPPGTLLAVSSSPEAHELGSLKALGLVRSVQADAFKGKNMVPVHEVVSEVASAMRAGAGCLIHCKMGTSISGTALACFLCKFGLGSVEEWNEDEPVALGVSEACELARGLRGNDAVDEGQVQFFEQSCWSEHVMNKLGRKQLASTEDVAMLVPLSGFRVVSQPADGNCMFHSLARGLKRETASNLRKKICAYMKENPELDISGTPLEEWVKMSAQTSVHSYAQKMSRSGEWGGGPEMAVCATMAGMAINVYESAASGYRLIACFNSGASAGIDILYVGRMHYDALERT